jgi:hypothetical protein
MVSVLITSLSSYGGRQSNINNACAGDGVLINDDDNPIIYYRKISTFDANGDATKA